jgi:serine/threonine protein kinase
MTGGDLRFHISRKTFTEEAVRFWVSELACALRYIHSQGIVHRDLKPDNVLLDEKGHAHLADFVSASLSCRILYHTGTFLTDGIFLTLFLGTERSIRFQAYQASYQQIWDLGLLGARSVRGQRLSLRS